MLILIMGRGERLTHLCYIYGLMHVIKILDLQTATQLMDSEPLQPFHRQGRLVRSSQRPPSCVNASRPFKLEPRSPESTKVANTIVVFASSITSYSAYLRRMRRLGPLYENKYLLASWAPAFPPLRIHQTHARAPSRPSPTPPHAA